MNPIENLWAILARRVYYNARQFASVVDLKEAIFGEWNTLSDEVLHAHIDKHWCLILSYVPKETLAITGGFANTAHSCSISHCLLMCMLQGTYEFCTSHLKKLNDIGLLTNVQTCIHIF